jgi:hypothetical protein
VGFKLVIKYLQENGLNGLLLLPIMHRWGTIGGHKC